MNVYEQPCAGCTTPVCKYVCVCKCVSDPYPKHATAKNCVVYESEGVFVCVCVCVCVGVQSAQTLWHCTGQKVNDQI